MPEIIPFAIAEELKALCQWVGWKYEERDGRRTKPPRQAQRPTEYADSTNPSTWAPFAVAVKSADNGSGLDGIGFVFTALDPFTGIDIDACRDPETGKIEAWAQGIIDMFPGAYVEITPSGAGIHIIIKGKLPFKGRKRGKLEVYGEDRYFTMTGWTLPSSGAEIPEHQAALDAFLVEHFPEAKPQEKNSEGPSRSWLTDEQVIKKASESKSGDRFKRLYSGDISGYPSHSEADAALALALSFWCGRNIEQMDRIFRASGLMREKWDQKHGAKTYGALTLERAAAMTRETYKAPGAKEAPKPGPTPAAPLDLTFPVDAMSGLAKDFAELYSRHLESPPEFFFFSCLTFLGAVLSGRLTAATELNPQPRLFTLILGESADDRKSTAISKTSDFYKEALAPGSIAQSWGVGSAEGLAGLFDANAGGCPRVLLLFDEFKAFVSKCMIEASVLLPCTNTLFEANTFHSRTKSSAITLDDAHLSVLAASTIQTFERCWTPAFRDIGFNNRLWLVPGSARQRFSIPLTIPKTEKARLRLALGSILSLVGDGLELPFTLEALRLYDEWYKARESSIHMKRLDVYALRLMLLLAVNDQKDHIDEDTAARAVRLCNWQLAVRRAYDPIDAEGLIARMEGEIVRQLTRRGALSKREAQQATNANRSGIFAFDTALQNLIKDGRVFWDDHKKLNLCGEV